MNRLKHTPDIPAIPPGRRVGFTLIELLVVIAVIMILAMIGVPTVGRVRMSASRAQARSEMASLENAILGYLNEYGRYPRLQPYEEDASHLYYVGDNSGLLQVLRGDEQNPRGIVFLSPDDGSLKREHGTINLFDPWDNPYHVVINLRYPDELIAANQIPGGEQLHRRIAIWSQVLENNNNNHGRDADIDDVVTSWK